MIGPGGPVYDERQFGEREKSADIVCDVCRQKHLTSTHAAGSGDALRLVPHTVLSLEQSMEFIKDDELVEVTPHAIRLRTRILSKEQRMKAQARQKS